MRKISILLFTLSIVAVNSITAQDISIRLQFVSYNNADPDGPGSANGSVQFDIQLMATAPGIMADGFGLLFVFQDTKLMATPTNTTVWMGPLASAAGWIQNVDNRAGNVINETYGGQTFDRRAVLAFAQPSAIPNMEVPTSWTSIVRVTYWTEGLNAPVGGYITTEPGSGVPQNSLSADGGGTEYPYLSPFLNNPLALPPVVTPVLFTNFSVECSEKGALVKWTTASEYNNSHYEVQKNTNGSWLTIGIIDADANSNTEKHYQFMDLEGGAAQYRVKQVDIDGTIDYTIIRSTNCKIKDIGVLLYPVPANDKLNLVIKTTLASRTELQIADMSGRIVKRTSVNLVNGSNNIPINVSDLAQGEYILISSDKSMQVNKKFVIAR